jgi:hypothetical protein
MSLVWVVECKICAQRFPALPRARTAGKSTEALDPTAPAGRFECPHCHEFGDYFGADLIPAESKFLPSAK